MNISNLSVGPSERRFTMLSQIRNRFALSEKGAKDFCKGSVLDRMAGCRTDVARRICVPIPARLDSSRLQPRDHNSTWDMLLRTTRNRIHGCHVCDCRLQYRSTYTCVYDESANRRISLAEKLRKLRSRSSEKRTCPT